MRVKERLLFNRIALHGAHVPPRDAQPAAFVETDLAHTDCALGQRTAVAARGTPEAAVGKRLIKLAVTCFAREHVFQCGHFESTSYQLSALTIGFSLCNFIVLLAWSSTARRLGRLHPRVAECSAFTVPWTISGRSSAPP